MDTTSFQLRLLIDIDVNALGEHFVQIVSEPEFFKEFYQRIADLLIQSPWILQARIGTYDICTRRSNNCIIVSAIFGNQMDSESSLVTILEPLLSVEHLEWESSLAQFPSLDHLRSSFEDLFAQNIALLLDANCITSLERRWIRPVFIPEHDHEEMTRISKDGRVLVVLHGDVGGDYVDCCQYYVSQQLLARMNEWEQQWIIRFIKKLQNVHTNKVSIAGIIRHLMLTFNIRGNMMNFGDAQTFDH